MIDILFYCSIAFLSSWITYCLKSRAVIMRSSPDGWLDINEYPIPDNIDEFLATDGNEIRSFYTPRYSKYGKAVFSEYNATLISHWMPLPDVPQKEKKQ